MTMILIIIGLVFLTLYGNWLVKRLSKRIGIIAATLYTLAIPFAFLSIYALLKDMSGSMHSFLNDNIYSTEFRDSTILTTLLCIVFFLSGFISHMLYLKRIKIATKIKNLRIGCGCPRGYGMSYSTKLDIIKSSEKNIVIVDPKSELEKSVNKHKNNSK